MLIAPGQFNISEAAANPDKLGSMLAFNAF